MALNSAKTAKAVTPDCRVHLVTNVSVKKTDLDLTFPGLVDRVTIIEAQSVDNRLFKTRFNRYLESERSVFLDCDTEVNADLSQFFG